MNEKLVIEYDSDEAANPMTLSGWASRSGHFYTEESMARWDGCTHKRCECGELTKKHYTKCKTCRDKADTVRYYARPAKEWDGKSMLFSDTTDEYFSSTDEAEDAAGDNGLELEDLRMIICEPVYARQIDSEFFCDDLPEDGELPVEIEDAIDAFNAVVGGIVLSWRPGKYRLTH